MPTRKKFTKDGNPVLVQSAIEDGAGHNIENTYAKQNGYYQGFTAGLADNLTPYSPDSGSEQSNPFNMEATGCGNGETQVDTGSYCQVKEKRGNGIVYNQLANPETAENDIDAGVSVVKNDDGTQTINGTATADTVVKLNTISFKAGHSYFISGCKNLANVSLYIIAPISGNIVPLLGGIITVSADTSTKVRLQVADGVTVSNQIINLIVVDLTKWFNGNVPTYLLSHPETFYRYYQGDLSYNEGQIKFSNSRYLYSIDRQQWDEEWEQGVYNPTTGEKEVDPNHVRSKNYIEIVPGAKYYCYNGTGTIRIVYYDIHKNYIDCHDESNEVIHNPSNAKYIALTMIGNYGTTYNNDITISLYYEGKSGYNQYYPYKLLQRTDTGPEQLYAAGEAYDVKLPSGAIMRNAGSYVFTGEETWSKRETQTTGGLYVYYYTISTMATGTALEGLCDKYVIDRELYGWNTETTECIRFGQSNNSIYLFLESDLTTAQVASLVRGMIIYYKLATPTTEQGTPYTEKLGISDFGSLRLEGTSGVPQGNLIFYPVDYKAYEDTLVNYTDGDVSNLALKSYIDNQYEYETIIVDNSLLAQVPTIVGGGELNANFQTGWCYYVQSANDGDNTHYKFRVSYATTSTVIDQTFQSSTSLSGEYEFVDIANDRLSFSMKRASKAVQYTAPAGKKIVGMAAWVIGYADYILGDFTTNVPFSAVKYRKQKTITISGNSLNKLGFFEAGSNSASDIQNDFTRVLPYCCDVKDYGSLLALDQDQYISMGVKPADTNVYVNGLTMRLDNGYRGLLNGSIIVLKLKNI